MTKILKFFNDVKYKNGECLKAFVKGKIVDIGEVIYSEPGLCIAHEFVKINPGDNIFSEHNINIETIYEIYTNELLFSTQSNVLK